MTQTRTLMWIALALLVTGCVNPMAKTTEPASTAKLPSLEGAWTVTLNQSGGLMGLSRNLIVTSTGEAILFDQKTMKYLPALLNQEKFDLFLAEYKNVDLANSFDPETCADCFTYQLSVDIGGTVQKYDYNDLTASQNGLAAISQLMVHLMDEIARQ